MNMAEKKQLTSVTEPEGRFWDGFTDPTQAAVHLALQWLAYVYPSVELQIDRTLNNALPYSDSDLSARWFQFLEEQDVEGHVEALNWMAKVISKEQIPFLVETCWRLVLVDHELPTHVPLALRILGQVIGINEQRLHEIGGNVFREFIEADDKKPRAPLLPVDPRYLDRIEWRLHGHTATARHVFDRHSPTPEKSKEKFIGFILGFFAGASVLAFVVFGPWQFGRISVERMQHEGPTLSQSTEAMVNETPTAVVASEPTDAPDSSPSSEEPQASDINEAVTTSESLEQTLALVEPSSPAVEESTPAPSATVNVEKVLMLVSANVLNVRAQATVESDVVAKLGKDAKVWAYPAEAVGLWMKIRFDDKEGYASARFMEPVGN
ncbi:SH3 domain-containing protein [Reinekea forsetii]|nr:SH3 domain-containing protein [Reinekea forsetii]